MSVRRDYSNWCGLLVVIAVAVVLYCLAPQTANQIRGQVLKQPTTYPSRSVHDVKVTMQPPLLGKLVAHISMERHFQGEPTKAPTREMIELAKRWAAAQGADTLYLQMLRPVNMGVGPLQMYALFAQAFRTSEPSQAARGGKHVV